MPRAVNALPTIIALSVTATLALGCDASSEGVAPADDASSDASLEDTATATDAAPPDDVHDATSDPEDADDTVAPPDPPPTTLGGERPAPVYVPASYDPAGPYPLAILLHGYTATGTLQDLYLGFRERATAAGFIAIIPDGTKNLTGAQFWNASPAWCCDFANSGVDDAGYLLGLVAEAAERLAVDPDRVYFVGHSNGGFMAHKMACDHAPLVAGIVDIAGSSTRTAAQCTPSAPVTVLKVHGTLDATIGYAGTANYPGAEALAERWVGYNGCHPDPLVSPGHDYDDAVVGAETTRSVWDGCDGGVLVSLWTLTGSGHVPTFNDAFLPAVFDFLLSHERTLAP